MAPKIPSSIACTSTSHLNDQLGLVKDHIELTETEDNWDKILTAILRLTALVNGSGADYPSQIVAACKEVAKGVNNSVKSERSRLSGAATDLLAALATNLGRAFEPLVNHFVPCLLTLASRPNKVFVSRARASLKAVAEYCQPPAMLPLLRNAVGDKAVSVRVTVMDVVLACLNCFNPPDLERPARAEDIEAIIKATARDANADVRKVSKQVFEAYCLVLPQRVNAFVSPLTPVMRKYLAIKGTSQPGPSKSTMASSATVKPFPPPAKEAPSRTRTISQTSRAPVAGPSRAPAPPVASKKPQNKAPSSINPKAVEMPPPPPPPVRQPSSGPVRPTPGMIQHVPAVSRPFTGKPFRPNKTQNVATSSSMTGGADITKSHGAQRPERPPSIEDDHSPMEVSRPAPSAQAPTTDLKEQRPGGHGPRRVPKPESVPQHSAPAQKPPVNVKEQKRNPIEVPLPISPSSSTSNPNHQDPSRPASRTGREPVFRRPEPPLTRSQSRASLSGSTTQGVKESSSAAANTNANTVKDTKTEDLTLEELTTVRRLPQNVEPEAKSEGADAKTKSRRAQRPQKPLKPEETAPPQNPPSRPAKNEEPTSRPPSSGEAEHDRVGPSRPARNDHHPRMEKPESHSNTALALPSSEDSNPSSNPETSRPAQERVRREKRPRPPATASDIEQSHPAAPAPKKRQPSGDQRNGGPSNLGERSSGPSRKVGRDGKPVARTKEEEEARAARKAAKRRKLELAQELLEREKAKELELRKARKAERAKAKKMQAEAEAVEAEAPAPEEQPRTEIQPEAPTAMEVEAGEAQGVETQDPEKVDTPIEDENALPQHIPVEVANDDPMETTETAQDTGAVVETPIQEQVADNSPVHEPLIEEPQDEPMTEDAVIDEVEQDTVPVPVIEKDAQMTIAELQVPSSPESSHTPQDSPPMPVQTLAPALKAIKPLSINKPHTPTSEESSNVLTRPRTPERPTDTDIDLPFNSHQFVTPAPLRQHMNAKKRQRPAPATPISKLLDSIEKGFEFNAGDFSIMEETEEEVANASADPESLAEVEEGEDAVMEDEDEERDTVAGDRTFVRSENETTPVAKRIVSDSDEGLHTPRFVDTRPRKGKRSERRPLATKNT